MGTFSFKLDENKINTLKDTFKDYIKPNTNEYIDTFIQKDSLTISIYKTNKVVFQGDDAFFYAQSYLQTKKIRQAGSDEVGTGDVFGPVVVCSAIVEENDYEFIETNHITDSKQVNDVDIRKLGPILMDRFKHSLLILDNEKYNNIHKNENLNQIKAKMHNQAYINLLNKGYDIPSACYVDQFCPVDKYYEYLKEEKRVYHDLIFEPKAESNHEAVAVASMIARYAFLIAMDNLSKKYNFNFHKGAGIEVDEDIKEFINKYKKEDLYKVSKVHFKNLEPYKL